MSTNDLSHLKLLAIFAQVVEQGSFAAAARKLHSSRSRISEQVSTLETSLGVRLLQRSTRRLKLTREGEDIFQEAKSLQQVLQRVDAIVTPEYPSGRVSLTLNHDIAHRFVMPLLPDLKTRYSDIQLDLRLDDKPQDLIDESIDLAIRIGFPKDSDLVARVLHEEAFGIFASPEFVAAFPVTDSVDVLSNYPWVLLAQTSRDGVLHLKQDEEHVRVAPYKFDLVDSPHLLQKMTLAGLGLALLLPTTVQQEVAQGKLVRVLPQVQSEPLVFSLIYPSRKHIPARTRAVIDFLMQANMFHR